MLLDPRIKSLSGTSSPGFMGACAAGQPARAYPGEPRRTAVNCNPNRNPWLLPPTGGPDWQFRRARARSNSPSVTV
jgi:hypothetical protein